MRIALVHPYSWPTVRRGGERYLHDLARWLVGAGHDVDIVTGAVPGSPPDESDGINLVRLPLWEPRALAHRGVTPLDTFGATVLPYLVKNRYDVVHSLVPSGALAAQASLQPSVYTVLGHPSPDNPPARVWSRALLTRAIRSVRVPAALSLSACAGAEALTGRRPHLLPPGVWTEEFNARTAAPSGPTRLLFNAFAGDQRKRLDVLLRAMPLVLAELPDARLALGGGGDVAAVLAGLDPALREAVEPIIDDLGAGSLADVPARFRAATVSVLPSVHEAFGLVLVESLACGTPVVCTSSGGMAEIVSEQVGRVAAPDDPVDLAAKVIEAVELAALPGTSAACTAHAKTWDWDVVGPRHESVYAVARG